MLQRCDRSDDAMASTFYNDARRPAADAFVWFHSDFTEILFKSYFLRFAEMARICAFFIETDAKK